MSQAPAVGIDIGGTKIAGALVDAEGRITHREQLATPGEGASQILDATAELVTTLVAAAGGQVSGVGMACAGMVDGRAGRLWFSPNLPLRDLDVAGEVRRRTGHEVVLENDANAAAWGEYRFGSGVDCDDMLLATVGTGVGGGCVIDDRLLRGAFGIGGEIGHVTMDPHGPRCGCGNHGCLEVYASGTALERYARELISSGEATGAGLRERCGDAPEALTGQDVTELARDGDEGAVALFARLGTRLGEGMASVCAVVDPAVVVIGGGVADAGDLLLDPTREAFAAHLIGRGHRPSPTIVVATLGNDAGLVGAATLAREVTT
ncbi:ROK family protein [Janibacter cremeus]|uniref:ROK family protein n=1 Tax=Janibacter cremeus TaxID=1285192 RepID=UPI0023F9CEEA|nr:ROK family protein [Janibacter cremeus]WEV78940.1 ROK family protein [Janibacter cremeus]